MRIVHAIAAFALLATPVSATAGDKRIVHAVQVGSETIRYRQGVATLDLQKADGAVQVTPLPFDHGGLSFAVAVFNAGKAPANIDVTNIAARVGPEELRVLTREQLESKAKSRAMWTQIALAAIGGIGAAAAASQRDHYTSKLVTPRGTYRAFYSAPSVAGQIQAAAITAGAGYGIASVQNRLDETRAALGQHIVQLTTVDPGESYAGQIVLTKIKAKALPQRVDLIVRWNGQDYPFAFQVAKRGTAAPVFEPVMTPAVVTEPASGTGLVAAGSAASQATPTTAP